MMKNYETAAIKINPAELTKEIIKSSAAQITEHFITKQVDPRKKDFDLTKYVPTSIVKKLCQDVEHERTTKNN